MARSGTDIAIYRGASRDCAFRDGDSGASRAEIAQPPGSTVKIRSGKPLPRIGRDELQGLEIITISGSRTREQGNRKSFNYGKL